MASSNSNFKTGDDWRKTKELDEARKAGLAPAERDEDGKEINPHIPQYMASAPWYLNSSGPSLKHQRNWNEKQKAGTDWYERGAKIFQADKFRKGACTNCGSMTHKAKDCCEKPRKKGAKWTGMNIAADEKIQEISLDFEGKRDRWNGYDADEYSRVIDRHEKIEILKTENEKEKALQKKFRKQERAGKKTGEEEDEDDDEEEDEEDDAKFDEGEMGDFAKVSKRVRTAGGGASGTVRNLRIREDTAKYLYNLDMSSAHYDPKTRSMREDPTPNIPTSDKFFAGDNFVRFCGDTDKFNELNSHAFEAFDRGQDVHMQAAPSQAEMLLASHKVKKSMLTDKTKDTIINKYGDASANSTEEASKALLLGQTEAYVEYDRAGRIIKGAEPVTAKSKYDEDVYINNHTAIWGSWWSDGTWGYACCKSHVKNSYCTGAAGLAAADAANRIMSNNIEQKEALADAAKDKEYKLNSIPKRVTWGTEVEEDVEIDAEKLKKALAKEKQLQDEDVETDERKRAYNNKHSVEVTEEEMEAYRLTKKRREDPLAEFKASGGGSDGYDLV
ncbi:hypothetical protein CYMTET_6391 [Cymbomonas tetramitiformis]|uniref:Pre-mRNA-splicing factor SLU7 n=1 Tax=Cymbomonas tetramitiformis TaxID=36881 RepID=A0AAE0GXL9_9CHLO|nr:hypothetical protein CYMTET_6391 [Cymbomonas tetramitiformis]|eukprot:gene1827-2496_t